MPVVVADNPTIAEHIGYRRPRSQPIPETDPNPSHMPSNQSTRSKSAISSLLSTFTAHTAANDNAATTPSNSTKKKNLTSATLRGLGCTASSQVSVPAAIRTSATWEAKKARKKKQRSPQQNKKSPHQAAEMTSTNPSSSVVFPDVWCGPGIGFTTDAASVDCVVSRRPVSGRGKVDGEKMNQRERSSCPSRRAVDSEDLFFMDSDPVLGVTHHGLDVFGGRYHHHHVRRRSPEGLAEMVLLQSGLQTGGRSRGFDQYREWRLDVDNMSYEELLELGDRIGHVSTGLKEDEILCCLRKIKCATLVELPSCYSTEMEKKCSICQEEYESDDEMGKLDCGHFYHIQCIKQWLVQKNTCPVCKTGAMSSRTGTLRI